MAQMRTRRAFLKTLAAGGAMGGLAPAAHVSYASGSDPAAGKPAIEAEVRRRADAHLAQRRLVVDYYRIRRQLAYPLPVASLSIPDVAVPSIPVYPWATWLLWALEERITSLGWAAEWFQDEAAQKAATADLAALSRWPEYQQYPTPDLSSAHAGRILRTALTCWRWVDDALRRDLLQACRRHVESLLPASDKVFAGVRTKEDILRRDAPHALLHNIPLIGTVGAALTAGAASHPAASPLNARLMALFGAILDLRAKGFTEGVGYDGYVLDFIADWLGVVPQADRSALLDHPHFDEYLEESCMLGAPGAVEQMAELGDVEPREMPFHLSAQAKLLRWRPNPERAWLMGRCRPNWLRTDALAALRAIPNMPAAKAPPGGPLDAHYAAVLRGGWEAEDLAVAISCTNSPMGHVQCDNGTLVIGTQGNWLIADPGYQQYVKGDERDFTVGPVAHNTPLINGSAQTQKRPRRIVLEEDAPRVQRVAVDLTACYPASASLKTLVRHVWLADNNTVVAADHVEAAARPRATYHWHAHPACAWWVEDNWALLTLDGVQLWFTSPQAKLSGAGVQRLPGSRGQLTLIATIESAGPVVWWAFAIGARRPDLRMGPDGSELRVRDRVFRAPVA